MHRRTALLVLPLIAALGLTGCSGSQGATKLDPKADVTIEFWTGQADEAEKLLEGLADEFEKDHPNVTIKVSSGASSTDELLQKLSAGFASDRYPDISYAFGSWASELESSKRTLDLTDYIADTPDLKWDEFSEAARATVQPTGEKIIGFPALVDNISLIYNKTLFDKAGVAYPTDDWSWDDFRTASKQLTDSANDIYGYAYSVSGSEETTWQFWPHLWQNGGAILNDDGTAAFDSQAGVDALEFLRGMAVDDKSVYLDQTDTKFAQLFAANRVAMMTSGPWQLYDLNTAKTDYGVTVLPGTNGDHQTVSGPDIWAAFDHKDVNREYWTTEFLAWLTAAPQDERWNVAFGNLPLRTSELDSDAFKEQVAALPGLDVMAENAANAKQARPTVKGYNGLSVAIGDAISKVLQGQGDPASALKDAVTVANEALAE